MLLLRFSLFCLMLHLAGSTALDESTEEATVSRIIRDITGKYHPELHGEHAHAHSHAHAQGGDADNGLVVDLINLSPPDQRVTGGGGGYSFPPPPPPTQPPPALNGYANCGCVSGGSCAQQVLDYQPILLRELKNDVVCGSKFQLCCYDDPWPGPIDYYKPLAPCVPTELCEHPYGSSPYDIQNYGVIGPCLGLGTVRCLDKKPGPPPPPTTGPTSYVVPIYEPPPPTEAPGYEYVPPPPPPPTTTTPPPVVYVPPPTEPITTPAPPVVYEPPPTLPPVVYVPPPTQPPVVYEPPTTLPPTVYEPPPTLPPVVYEPPVTVPPVVETYVPPAPVETYVPPTPVETYEPPVPVETYEPPTPVETYEPPTPVETYEPPAVEYGVPVDDVPVRSYGHPYSRLYPQGGYFSRFGGYPGYGFGFRKRFGFYKGFYG